MPKSDFGTYLFYTLLDKSQPVAGLLADHATVMIGFLIALLSILFALVDTVSFRSYLKRTGSVFTYLCAWALILHFALFGLACTVVIIPCLIFLTISILVSASLLALTLILISINTIRDAVQNGPS